MLPPIVIDTNVIIVANGREIHASVSCQLTSIRKLREAQTAQRVLIDDGLLIMSEYRIYGSYSGQPGVGDAFFKWLWDNQATSEVCRKVPITVDPDDAGTFVEFPKERDLKGFDRSDHKFVAVVVASREDVPVLDATDSDWWNYREALARHNVRVEFICLDMMPASKQKPTKRR